ncbi:MAG TPA: amidohydrolase family protein, partial [Metabacillus sp.]|nr:amidohydrolase family protein [Metabacillus sp.]
FVLTKKLTLKQLIDFLTIEPAKAFGLAGGSLKVGEAADITVLDLNNEASIDPNEFLSKGKNTPFTGWNCKGWPTLTIVDGNIAWEKGGITV